MRLQKARPSITVLLGLLGFVVVGWLVVFPALPMYSFYHLLRPLGIRALQVFPWQISPNGL